MPTTTTRSKTPTRPHIAAILAQNAKFPPFRRPARASRPAPKPAPRIPSSAQIDAAARNEAQRQNAALEKLHKVKYYTSGADAAHQRAKATTKRAWAAQHATVRDAAAGDPIAIESIRQHSGWYHGRSTGTNAEIAADARKWVSFFASLADAPAPAAPPPAAPADHRKSWAKAVRQVNIGGLYAQRGRR